MDFDLICIQFEKAYNFYQPKGSQVEQVCSHD